MGIKGVSRYQAILQHNLDDLFSSLFVDCHSVWTRCGVLSSDRMLNGFVSEIGSAPLGDQSDDMTVFTTCLSGGRSAGALLSVSLPLFSLCVQVGVYSDMPSL